ncbi:hypothetical protein KGP36_03415 [Patescibacteria group bacterium]|nr:hypothetical protein [Patescibacteria group bacterium]
MLPASFARDGFLPPDQLRKGKLRRLMVGTDGWPNTGKTEFALSAPGPGIVICLDRGFESMLDNPHPPVTRRSDFAFKVITVPLPTQLKQPEYVEHWRAFYSEYLKALANPDARTVVLDGDSDSWELQRLAEFGRTLQVPSLQYANVNNARKAMISRAWDSGKIFISTNKLSDGYETKLDKDNKATQVKTGKEKRQGFNDWGYLYSVQLRHLYHEGQFGVRILMCKSDTSLQGLELWGEDCNFKSLVQTIYPQIPLNEWGY